MHKAGDDRQKQIVYKKKSDNTEWEKVQQKPVCLVFTVHVYEDGLDLMNCFWNRPNNIFCCIHIYIYQMLKQQE